jgi:hypothetical protein
MSYDISLRTPDGGDHLELNEPHGAQGGTYALGGTTEAWLNVTYNYSPHFYKVFGEKGIRTIYGLSAEQSIPLLAEAIGKLCTDTDPDYWKSTEGNARQALINLLCIASQALAEGKGAAKWDGD